MRVGFAGAGNIAAAMARGWAAAAERGPEALLFSDAGSGRAATLADELGGEAASLPDLAARSDVVVLAVKPAALPGAAAELGDAPALISVLGATPLERLRESFPGKPLVRAMLTVASEIRRSVVCHAPLGPPEREVGGRLLELLGLLGRLYELPDERLDAATAIMGCTPAYLALVVEAIAGAGASEGIAPELAHELVVETFAGTAELLRARDPAAVRRAVASPGGSTEAGLAALDAARVPEALADAVRASLERMRA